MGTFAEWQPLYARRGVATFPVEITADSKKPCTSGYLKTGLRGSAQLAVKFAEARSFGFACGRGTGDGVDMDDSDPAISRKASASSDVAAFVAHGGGSSPWSSTQWRGRCIRPLRLS
jgi:hypothetical protein